MAKVIPRSVIGVTFALVTAALLAAVSFYLLRPPSQAELEEARIFNTDDAQWFGEDPDFGIVIEFLGIGQDEQGAYADIRLNSQLRKIRQGELIAPPCLALAEILEDGLLVNQCGGYALVPAAEHESGTTQHFTLPSEPTTGVQPGPPEVVDLRQDQEVVALAKDYHKRLYQRPLSLRGKITVEVQRDPEGERRYFISPGEDKRLFRQLPLQPGDEVRAINGITLGERESFSDLYKRLAGAHHLTVTLERGEEDLVILLGL